MEIIENKASHSFYLKLGIPSLFTRIKNEKAIRPIVASLSNDDLPEFIGKHIFERSPFYSKAKHIITCDTKSKEDIVKEIKFALL